MHKKTLAILWFSFLLSTISAVDVSITDNGAVADGVTSDPRGEFYVSDGKIYTPKGQVFMAKGIAILSSTISSSVVHDILSVIPNNLNMIRVAINLFPLPNPLPSTVMNFISTMTSRGIVCTINDHSAPTAGSGSNIPGTPGTVYPGGTLANEVHWYSAMATTFLNNSYVWIETMNEPADSHDESQVTNQEVQIYNAVRATGKRSPIIMETVGGSFMNGMVASDYTNMTDIIWDTHFYGWVSHYSTDQNTVTKALTSQIESVLSFTRSANGAIPVIIGEWGNSASGKSIDVNWQQVMTAAQESGYGNVAWAWSDYGMEEDAIVISGTTLTVYGKKVVDWINR